MMDWHVMADIVTASATVVAAIAAVVATIGGFRQGLLSWRSYLHIGIHVDSVCNGFLTVMTVVENKGLGRKELENALLLIGPENESPLDTMCKIGLPVDSTNDIMKCDIDDIKSGPDGRCLIPIDFYYSENVRIADEKMSYRVPISTRNMRTGVPYSVRFFIYAPGRLHRSTQDCFILPKGDGG